MNEKMTAAEAFESEVVQIANRTAARFQERLAAERAMADTVAVGSDEEVRQLCKDNAVLMKRIEELEAEGELLNIGLARIAYVLRTFYYAQLSISAIQPLLALCLELNPEIVEQRR